MDLRYRIHAEEVVEMRHGKWLEKDVSHINLEGEMQSARCSCCGLYHTTPFLYYFKEYKYCPNCGARMDGGDENERSDQHL